MPEMAPGGTHAPDSRGSDPRMGGRAVCGALPGLAPDRGGGGTAPALPLDRAAWSDAVLVAGGTTPAPGQAPRAHDGNGAGETGGGTDCGTGAHSPSRMHGVPAHAMDGADGAAGAQAAADGALERALAIADAATAAIGSAAMAVRSAAALAETALASAGLANAGLGAAGLGGALPDGAGAGAEANGMLRRAVGVRDVPGGGLRRFRRVAIVHYWLVTMRGGERVLERLLRMFPEADVFTHVYDPAGVSDLIRSRKVHTSFIQKLPFARRHYQSYLPLMPMALEQLDLRGYDLVISSESGPAKGVICAPDALHMCYVHSPMRYLWDHYHDYRAATGLVNRMVMPWLCHGLRQWDTASAARVDRFVANSRFIEQRIAKAWRRPASVVHPPVETQLFAPATETSPSWLWVGQLVPYKRADLAIDAFNRLGLPLTVVGDGPMAASLRKRAGPTIRMIPRMTFDQLRAAYARARALVFTAEEDFGIVPVEVMASGRPVLAYGRGGALDSVVDGHTGRFFAEQTVDCLTEAVAEMERWLPEFQVPAALARARAFAPEVFDRGIIAALADA